MVELTILIAFIAGLVSFLAPCILPLVPAFLGFLAGRKIERASRWALFYHSFLFVLGFSTVFSLLGVLLNSLLSNIAYDLQIWLGRIAGTIIILFGFYMLGLIKPAVLQQEHKFKVKKFHNKSLTSFVFGAAFAVGWTPCVGAVLGAVLTLAVTHPGTAFWLLIAYTLGLGIPFLLVGFFVNEAQSFLNRAGKWIQWMSYLFGAIQSQKA